MVLHTNKYPLTATIIMPIYMYLLSFDESNVEQRGVEVKELEDVHFECELVFILSLSAVELWRRIALFDSNVSYTRGKKESMREAERQR